MNHGTLEAKEGLSRLLADMGATGGPDLPVSDGIDVLKSALRLLVGGQMRPG